ncbi:MAG: sulfatase [Planctomycetia bacterium]
MNFWKRLLFFLLTAAIAQTTSKAAPPNVILILMDDMGWRDVGFMGNDFVETPYLDRLAAEGLVFRNAYASAPNCAPTRACLMSGQYTPRHGIYTVVDPRQPPGSPWHKLMAADSKSELDTRVITVAESLQNGGYTTAFFGMWNLGRGRTGPMTPGGQGFDKVVFPENLGFGKDAYFDDQGNYLSDRLTDAILEFVEDNQNRPFFAYLPDHAVHAPYEPKQDLLQKYEKKLEQSNDRRDNAAAAATIEAVDQNVGRILQRLTELNLRDNTVVIFTSDNGGTNQFTPPLKGGKGQLYEGGIRIPLVVSWPALKNPGRFCDAPVASVDWYPTLLELAGLKAPEGQVLDGISLVPALHNAELPLRDYLFWHFPCYVGRATPSSAVRAGDWKLIEFFEEGGSFELYDLKQDPHEERDLSAKNPEKTAELRKILKDWQKQTGAALPSGPNPAFDANAARQRGPNPSGGSQQKGNGQKKGQKGRSGQSKTE